MRMNADGTRINADYKADKRGYRVLLYNERMSPVRSRSRSLKTPEKLGLFVKFYEKSQIFLGLISRLRLLTG